ncbi:O-antigen polymerase [Shewanella sp.]|uniref:O-antigen polymerase n=1 Tax=Shewanella sp. TaxID=50422 RepID=UPI004047581C
MFLTPKKLVQALLLFIFPLSVGISVFDSSKSVAPLVSSMAIILYSIISLYSDKAPYSLKATIFIFAYIFFGLISILNYYLNIRYWDAPLNIDAYEFVFANIWILLFLIIIQLSSLTVNGRVAKVKSGEFYFVCATSKVLISSLPVIISLIILFYNFYLNNFDILNMLTRGKFGGGDLPERSLMRYIIDSYFIIPILSINLLVFLYFFPVGFKKTKIILFIILLTGASPTSSTRIVAAFMYLPLIFFIFHKRITKLSYILFIMGSVFIAMFLIDFFRVNLMDQEFDYFELWLNTFHSGHFDAYQSFLLAINGNLTVWGQQLLGVFLFFVPRALWVDKPVGTSILLSDNFNLSFDNISVTLPAEGFINFGFFGIVSFAIVVGALIGKLDFKFWKRFDYSNAEFRIGYFYLIPLLFFIMRGDLLSALPFTLSVLSAVYLTVKVYRYLFAFKLISRSAK